MTGPRVERVQEVTLDPARDGRLHPYGWLGFCLLGVTIVVGEPSLASVAAPFMVAFALGMRRREPIEVTARLTLEHDRVLEGDTIAGRVEVSWTGEMDAHLMLDRLRGVEADSPSQLERWTPSTERIELPIRLTATRWGRHALADVWLRLTLPGGLVTWTGRVVVAPPIRVLPGSERLTRLLSPAESRTVWGVHRSNRSGEGHEFSELKPYAPGDRLRDLNWAATARHGRPFVNRHHPEVSGTVVIALEMYDDGSAEASRILTRAARAAWALARAHLDSNDRVGLIGLGGATQWLPPGGGRLAKYRLMEALLGAGGEAVERASRPRRGTHAPSGAHIIALTTLQDERSLGALLSWRARGRQVAVAVVGGDALSGRAQAEELLARRLWDLEIERRMATLRGVGVPAVRVPPIGAMGPVVSALRQAGRRR